jgi:hypothetical protein
MNTWTAGLLALTIVGAAAIALAPGAAADPTCTDLAGQASVCQEVAADPATGVYVYVNVDVHPAPPA